MRAILFVEPLHDIFVGSSYDAMFAISHHNVAKIRCSTLNASEFASSVEAGVPSDKVVLTVTAIVTLELLDGWKLLDPNKAYYVSRSTFELLESWAEAAAEEVDRESAHSSDTDDGKLQLHESTREERERTRDALTEVKRQVEARCTVSSSAGIASIDPSRRTGYERVAGYHNLEAMGLAKDVNAALLSDDAMISFIATADFGVPSICTQMALRLSLNAGVMTGEDYDRASAKLVAYRYEAIVWNVLTIMRAGELADWDPNIWPFKQCIDLVGIPNMPIQRRAILLLEVLEAVRTSSCGVMKQSAVIQAVLSAVKRPRLIAAIYKRLPDLLDDNIPALNFLAVEVGYWLRNHLT